MKKYKIALVLVLIVLITTIIVIIPNKKLKEEETIEFSNSNSIAYYFEQEDGTYKDTIVNEDVNYIMNSKSYCTNNAIPSWENGKVKIKNLTSKNTSCFIYFNISKTLEDIIASSKQEPITLSKTSCSEGCEENTVGLYCWDVDTNSQCTEDSTNKTYFYRGDVENNYVKFAGFYWRIIRINESGSLRLLYSGKISEIDLNGKEILSNEYDDSKSGYTTIGENSYSGSSDSQITTEYTGFMYTEGEPKGYENSSEVKNTLEKWYIKNLTNLKTDEKGNVVYENEVPVIDNKKINYEQYLDKTSGFCGDRSLTSGTGFGSETTIYAAYTRLFNNDPQPTYQCVDKLNDLYTVENDENNGNQKLTYPVGLITADEAIYAGITTKAANSKNYLFSGTSYWTMTPEKTRSNFTISSKLADYSISGGQFSLNASGNSWDWNLNVLSVRPVINLSVGELLIKGNGTINNPYIINSI